MDFPTSLPAFQRTFSSEVDCTKYLEFVRWPAGFICPKCGCVGSSPYRFASRPEILRCRDCHADTSLTANTIMHKSKMDLSIWFWAAYLVSSQTPGISAVQFQRQLGINRYETAFNMLHKLRAAMVRPDRDLIGSKWPVEIDETYVGGKTRGQGRGVHHKAIVAGAVEVCRKTGSDGKPNDLKKPKKGQMYAGRLRLQVVPNRSREQLEGFVLSNVVSGARITTDGWNGYDNLPQLGYGHQQVVMAGDPKTADEFLPMIHIIFSNLKSWLRGIHHGVSEQHLQAYLNEYVFRFNRRFWPFSAFNSLLGIGVKVEGPTYEGLYSGEWVHPHTNAA